MGRREGSVDNSVVVRKGVVVEVFERDGCVILAGSCRS